VPLDNYMQPPPAAIPISIAKGTTSVRAEKPIVVRTSSVGLLGGHVTPREISLPLGNGTGAKVQFDEKSVIAYSGWRATTILENPTLGQTVDLSQLSSGYRIVEQRIGYTDYITIIPSG
jgi:hypothetical protein